MHKDYNISVTRDASTLVYDVLTTLTSQERFQNRYDEISPRGMKIREMRNVQLQLRNPMRCATWLKKRELNYPFMWAEWLWIQTARDDVGMISHYCKEISKFSDDGLSFFGAYGPRWYNAMSEIIPLMERDPDTRQAVAGIWRPDVYRKSFETRDVPCTLSMQYYIRRNLLEATVVMRSSDAWLGLPYDLFNFAMLQRSVARALGRGVGPMTVIIGSCHLYERDLERAREVVNAGLVTTSYDPTQILIPEPPAFNEHFKLVEFEERFRTGGESTGEDPKFYDWFPHLTMLDYRNHKDKALVEVPLRDLLS